MSSEFLNTSRHILKWVVRSFEYYILACSDLETGTKSLVAEAKSLTQTSWYLSVRVVEYDNEEICVELSLKRDIMDGGPEIIEVDWTMEVIRNHRRNVVLPIEKKDIVIKTFKRGDSNIWGTVKIKRPIFQVTIECSMSECFPVEIPITESTTVWTQAELSSMTLFGDNDLSLMTYRMKYDCYQKAQFEFCLHIVDDYIGIRIRRLDKANDILCYVTFIVSFYDGSKTLLHSVKSEETCRHFSENYVLEMPTYFKVSDFLNSYWNGSSLEFRYFDIQFICSVSTIHEKNGCTKHISDSSTINELQNDFLRMFTDKMHCDVKLQVGDEIMSAHKCVLSARSSILTAMDEGKMITCITDLDAKTLELLLKFIYTGSTDEMDCEMALKLLLAAEKYQVIGLKEVCSTFLLSAMSEETVCDILNVADIIDDKNLKMLSMEYVEKNADKILLSKEWNRFVEKNVALVSEILRNLSILRKH